MKKIKAVKVYEPEIKLESILAYKHGCPETYTRSELVNAVCELLSDKRGLVEGHIAEHLGIESKHLAFTLEVLTGYSTSDLRAEMIAHRWRTYMNEHPHCTPKEIGEAVGFSDYAALWKFMERNKSRFPELYLKEQEAQERMAIIVEKQMPQESAFVQRLYIKLPYRGSAEEKEACVKLLYKHSRKVADLALEIARHHPEKGLDLQEVEQMALLHNVGIVMTDTPEIHCHGDKPYISHGEAGSTFLNRHTRTSIAPLVAMSHLGAGIDVMEAFEKKLDITVRIPERSIERLICYASCFYSIFNPGHRKSADEIRQTLSQYGTAAVERFGQLEKEFGSL